MVTKKTEPQSTSEDELDIQDSKFTIFAKKFYRKYVKGISHVRQILFWYFFITLLGTLFLMTPWVLKDHTIISDYLNLKSTPVIWDSLNDSGNLPSVSGFVEDLTNNLTNYLEKPGFLNSLFMASSAFSDTGLTTVGISFTYNWFGQLVLLLLLEIGGIGWFSIKIFVLLFFIRKVKYSTLSQSSFEKGMVDNKLAIGVIKTAVIVTIGSTIIFGLIFGIMFATIEPTNLLAESNFSHQIFDTDLYLFHLGPGQIWTWPPDCSWENLSTNWFVAPADGVGLQTHWLDSFRVGFFHAGASINNSGLDMFKSGYSLAGYYGNYGIQTITIMLFILGGIGFSVVYDIYQYIINKATGQKFRFSFITKISVITYFLVAFIGLSFVFLIEGISTINETTAFLTNEAYGTPFERTFALVFNTFSTRNAGFSTINISLFSSATQISYMFMMFIGSGPGSTAGGLRTTTFFVIVMSTWSQLQGKKHTNAFKKTISNKQCYQARNTLIFSIILIIIGTMIVFGAEDVHNEIHTSGSSRNDYAGILSSFFVVTSAFGTTGLSPVSLANATIVSKLVIILIMFLGKMGMSTTIEQFEAKKPIDRRYLEEYVNLG